MADRKPLVVAAGQVQEVSASDVLAVAQLKLTGGTPGAGKVATSDASGLITLQDPPAGGAVNQMQLADLMAFAAAHG